MTGVTHPGSTVHELAITESVIRSVEGHCGGRRVDEVTLVIGRLSGVVADSVRFCFDLCTQGTCVEGARLEVVDAPGRAHCRTCDTDVELPDLIALCPCGSADLAITGGQELRIESIEVVTEESVASGPERDDHALPLGQETDR